MSRSPKKPLAPGGRFDATLSLRTPTAVRNGLDAYAASEKLKRSRAASLILEDWLRTHGWLVDDDHPKPTGPATDVVHAMEAAIKSDRARKKR